MATFDFPYHTYETQYQENQFRARLGGNWLWTAAPDAPEQRIFKLSFKAMRWFFTSLSSDTIDRTATPQLNIAALEDFYKAHLLHTTFVYPAVYHGNVNCKFNKPFILPKGVEGGNGTVQGFELEFIEIP